MAKLQGGCTIPLVKGGKESIGSSVQIIREIGGGGQGKVYLVSGNVDKYALKWYTSKRVLKNKDELRKNIETLITKGNPSKRHFVWPQVLTEEVDGCFGYIMDVLPPHFSSFEDYLLDAVRFSSFTAEVHAALNIVDAFGKLHRKGYSYKDLSDGNFFINMDNGEVLIIDNDNVSFTSTDKGVKGTEGYMAPEIVTGAANPSRYTDYHSLAVVLFFLFIKHHPLQGERCRDNMNETDIYGVNPVFIFDPNNKSNRPTVSAVNPRTFWPAFPKFFQDAFITTFVQGLKDPSKRLMDAQWQDVLLRLRDEVSVCPRCGKDFLWKDGRGECCGNGLEKPKCLHIGDFRVPLFPKQRLYACHTQENGKDNFERQTGSITSKRLGIKNLSDDEWSYLLANGRKQCVRKDQVIPLDLMKEGIDAVMFNGVKGYIGEAPGFVLCLSVKDMTLTLSGGAKLRVCHTTQGTGDTPITGEVKFNKRTKDIHDLVICNYSDDEWTLIAPDGRSRRTLKKEEAPVPLRPGMMIQFMQGLTGTVSRI